MKVTHFVAFFPETHCMHMYETFSNALTLQHYYVIKTTFHAVFVSGILDSDAMKYD